MVTWLRRWFARLELRMRQFLCGLHGHDALLHFEDGRMSLLCASCKYDTPGWDCSGAITRPPTGPTVKTTPRPRVVRMPLRRVS
jgi:hypothetical protein